MFPGTILKEKNKMSFKKNKISGYTLHDPNYTFFIQIQIKTLKISWRSCVRIQGR